jgi:hypothetical protein
MEESELLDIEIGKIESSVVIVVIVDVVTLWVCFISGSLQLLLHSFLLRELDDFISLDLSNLLFLEYNILGKSFIDDSWFFEYWSEFNIHPSLNSFGKVSNEGTEEGLSNNTLLLTNDLEFEFDFENDSIFLIMLLLSIELNLYFSNSSFPFDFTFTLWFIGLSLWLWYKIFLSCLFFFTFSMLIDE